MAKKETRVDSGSIEGEAIEEIHQRILESEGANLTADREGLTAWDRVKLSRHPDRPYTLDYVDAIFSDFIEVHGDRRYGDDPAIVAGLARFRGRACVVIGHQNGRTTKQRQHHNFAMPKPEGYRKALRVMRLAEKFRRPIFSFIDTPGAYPGIDAEERGQAEAIAYNLREMSRLKVPVVVTVTGQGGSGGALAIGVGDQVLMMENAIYSVISPEGCASILWRSSEYAEQAALALRLTAGDLLAFGLIDRIVPEPKEGAHTDHRKAAEILEGYLDEALDTVSRLTDSERVARRHQKFRVLGQVEDLAHEKGVGP